ncbi:hypothetical protein XENOCAPTIV_025143 [Xenoophorus captivus]|uniref:Uncharacterized protein n=1 Tax=Xenoophorus captivus TaxID=1517983 RepID=A0ABV0R3A9_9TELE
MFVKQLWTASICGFLPPVPPSFLHFSSLSCPAAPSSSSIPVSCTWPHVGSVKSTNLSTFSSFVQSNMMSLTAILVPWRNILTPSPSLYPSQLSGGPEGLHEEQKSGSFLPGETDDSESLVTSGDVPAETGAEDP